MKIKFNAPTIYKVGGIMLVSGVNEVEDNAELKKFLANPLVKLDIESKLIEIEKAAEKPAEKTTKAK